MSKFIQIQTVYGYEEMILHALTSDGEIYQFYDSLWHRLPLIRGNDWKTNEEKLNDQWRDNVDLLKNERGS